MPSILPALRALLFALLMVSLLVIAGCGLKGDLVLPGPGEASSSQPEGEEDTADDDSRDPAGASQ